MNIMEHEDKHDKRMDTMEYLGTSFPGTLGNPGNLWNPGNLGNLPQCGLGCSDSERPLLWLTPSLRCSGKNPVMFFLTLSISIQEFSSRYSQISFDFHSDPGSPGVSWDHDGTRTVPGHTKKTEDGRPPLTIKMKGFKG